MSAPEKPYKILITTDLYTTDTNGVVTSVKNLFDELKSKGHDVKILTFSENIHSRREGDVTFIRSMSLEWVYPNVRMPMSYRHKLIKDIIDWKPDIIHSQCEFSASSMPPGSPSSPARPSSILTTPSTSSMPPMWFPASGWGGSWSGSCPVSG